MLLSVGGCLASWSYRRAIVCGRPRPGMGPPRGGASFGLCMLLAVLAGCADNSDSEPGKLAAQKAVLESAETLSAEESPRRPAGLAQSVSSTASRDELTAADGRWVVSRMANPQGAFVLVRNVTADAVDAATVRVGRGEGGGGKLGPRETVVWDCDDDAMPLTVRTDDGTLIYDASLECGDALYVRRRAAVSDALE